MRPVAAVFETVPLLHRAGLDFGERRSHPSRYANPHFPSYKYLSQLLPFFFITHVRISFPKNRENGVMAVCRLLFSTMTTRNIMSGV
jgi:hypothetical protein